MKTLKKHQFSFIRAKQTEIMGIILCMALIFSSCGGNIVKKEKVNDWTDMRLKGQVKRMTEKKDGDKITVFYTFDEKGNLNEKGLIRSYPVNKTVVIERHEYDTIGKLAEISFFGDVTGELKNKNIYKEGVLSEEQTYSTNYSKGGKPEYTLTGTKSYTYDKEGKLLQMIVDNNQNIRLEYECDDAGNIIKMVGFHNNKPVDTRKFSYQYDKHGNSTKFELYYPIGEEPQERDGGIDHTRTYKYDDNDRMIEKGYIAYLFNSSTKENEKSQKITTTFQHDEQGNVIKKTEVTCNYKNNKETGCSDPLVTTYIYQYDKHGNWTSREEWRNGQKYEVGLRKYTYYGEEENLFSAEDMVGVWDYYAESDPQNKIEIVFKKDGTLIDYIDFHSTGTYKVNEDGSIITMQFFYNDGETSQESKPFEYKVLDYSENCFKITNGGSNAIVLVYDKKEKSDNYTGDL